MVFSNIPWIVRIEILSTKWKFSISFPLVSATLNFLISCNLVCKGRIEQGAFFFLCIATDNPMERWYTTSYMTNLSVSYLGKRCGDFCLPNTLRKVPSGEAKQSVLWILLPLPHVTCKVALPQIRSSTNKWGSDQLASPLLLCVFTSKASCNKHTW